MSWTDQVGVIRQKFDDDVGSSLDLQVRHDNDPRDPPTDETWIGVSIVDGETGQAEVGAGNGANTHRTVGVLIASVFTQIGAGDSVVRLATEKIKEVFRSTVVGETSFGSPTISVIGRRGPKWQVNVTCPFKWEEIA